MFEVIGGEIVANPGPARNPAGSCASILTLHDGQLEQPDLANRGEVSRIELEQRSFRTYVGGPHQPEIDKSIFMSTM